MALLGVNPGLGEAYTPSPLPTVAMGRASGPHLEKVPYPRLELAVASGRAWCAVDALVVGTASCTVQPRPQHQLTIWM